MTCEYDPVAERHLCGPRICRCEPTEAERAYETYRERVDGRVNPASAWLAAWELRGERDAQIADEYATATKICGYRSRVVAAEEIAAEIRGAK